MAVREYIGARYVPVFADPIEWDSQRAYEPLTMVTYQGSTYISRQAVPIGVDNIDNTEYWLLFSVFSAQVEQYRQEVIQFDERISDNAQAIETETAAREALEGELSADIAAETLARSETDTELNNSIDELKTPNNKIMLWYRKNNDGIAQTSAYYVRLRRDSYNFGISNCDGSNSNRAISNPFAYAQIHPTIDLALNAAFFNATEGQLRIARVNDIDYNMTDPAPTFPFLAMNTNTQNFEYIERQTTPSTISQEFNNVFQCGDFLVRDGVAYPPQSSETYTEKANRQAFGWDDEYYYIIGAEGRAIGNPGMTLTEFGAFIKSLGIRNAINLDGGGSACAAINNPSTIKLNNTRDWSLPWPQLRPTPLVMYFYQKGI